MDLSLDPSRGDSSRGSSDNVGSIESISENAEKKSQDHPDQPLKDQPVKGRQSSTSPALKFAGVAKRVSNGVKFALHLEGLNITVNIK